MMLGVDMIRRGAHHHGPRIAISYGDASLSFAETDSLASSIANVFIGLGLAPQEPVALLINNSLYSVPIDFACMKARLIRVPLNARLSAKEHLRMLEATDARVLIHGADLAERAAHLRELAGGAFKLIAVGPGNSGDANLLDLVGRASASDPMLPTPPDDIVLALFTSGTTGTLKAAQHSQASWAAIATNVLTNLAFPSGSDVMLHAASMIHASGTFVLPFWLRGARSAILDGFDPGRYLDQVAASGATHINLVPTMLAMLLNGPGSGGRDIGRLRSVIYGASPMPRPVIEAGLDLWGPIFSQYYGQTEAPLAMTVLAPEDHVGPDAPLGACGQPSLDVDLKLVDELGEAVAAGEIGEIAVRGPMLHVGYRNTPELDREARLPNGFMRTRDLGRFDERGFLYLVDRTSDMIVTGGYNVYPREVEDALLAHQAVVECAVVGAPDEKWVEAVTAFVVVRPGSTVSDAELLSWTRDRLAGFKVPKRVERLETLPKSAVGKILRRALREPLWAHGREG
jgi:acyl-CoA synthetase (AMP-forming)/AMP-acid ligase II